MTGSSKQKVKKEILILNDILEQRDITDIYRTFLAKTPEYTFSSSIHRTQN